MTQHKAKRLFILYYQLYLKYQQAADSYRSMTGSGKQLYSDFIAKRALEKANEYQLIAEGV